MSSLFETIKVWADGQNALNARNDANHSSFQGALERLSVPLRRCGSLEELAAHYYSDDGTSSCRRVAEEFFLNTVEREMVRGASHWQRFMEIRHPEDVPR